MHLAWLTDIHLDFVDELGRDRLGDAIAATGADGAIVTGDIATGPGVCRLIAELAERADVPTWFVLGNHDFYHSSIATVRGDARALTAKGGLARWLPATGVVKLSDDTALVGHDGWGDARLGDFEGSRVMLNDFLAIEDLARRARPALRARLEALGDEAGAALAAVVDEALGWARHVIVATHVPPFREACWHEGAISNDDWLPFFTCAATGAALRAAMSAQPDARMTVLCGHTHSGGVVDVLPNLRVHTGGARYGVPHVVGVLDPSGALVAHT